MYVQADFCLRLSGQLLDDGTTSWVAQNRVISKVHHSCTSLLADRVKIRQPANVLQRRRSGWVAGTPVPLFLGINGDAVKDGGGHDWSVAPFVG